MANNYNKKLGILLLKDYLVSRSDENHTVSVPDMIDMLANHEIESDRKTIYRDLKILKDDYGLDLISGGYKYHVASREFELEEIKILVDMVQSSNFITQKKTKELLDKLKQQVSIYDAEKLDRRIYVRSRIKATNESVYINVDKISEAISNDKKVSFKYYHYNTSKEKELSHDGLVHVISPFALIYVDQNYYMLGYDSVNMEMRHYRIDRMTAIDLTDESREGHKLFEHTDVSTYTNKVFSMFTGDECKITLRCRNYVSDSIIDRFGEDVMLIPDGNAYFTVSIPVVVSPQFYAWISAFGSDIEILRPMSVREGFKNHIDNIAKLYSPNK